MHATNETGWLAAWWGLGDADPTVVGVLIVAVVALAIAYVVTRLTRKTRAKRD